MALEKKVQFDPEDRDKIASNSGVDKIRRHVAGQYFPAWTGQCVLAILLSFHWMRMSQLRRSLYFSAMPAQSVGKQMCKRLMHGHILAALNAISFIPVFRGITYDTFP